MPVKEIEVRLDQIEDIDAYAGDGSVMFVEAPISTDASAEIALAATDRDVLHALVAVGQPIATWALARSAARRHGVPLGGRIGWCEGERGAYGTDTPVLVCTDRSSDAVNLAAWRGRALDAPPELLVVDGYDASLNQDALLEAARRSIANGAALRLVVRAAQLPLEGLAARFDHSTVVRVVDDAHVDERLTGTSVSFEVQRLVCTMDRRRVVVFVPRMGDVDKTLRRLRSTLGVGVAVLPLHATLPWREQIRPFAACDRPLVVVTNEAVPGLRADAVVDRGRVLRGDGPERMDVADASPAQCRERLGVVAGAPHAVYVRRYLRRDRDGPPSGDPA